jgi:hypothetical protein
MAIAVLITALIPAIIDALHAEFIGDGTAGIRLGPGYFGPRISSGSLAILAAMRLASSIMSTFAVSASAHISRA